MLSLEYPLGGGGGDSANIVYHNAYFLCVSATVVSCESLMAVHVCLLYHLQGALSKGQPAPVPRGSGPVVQCPVSV